MTAPREEDVEAAIKTLRQWDHLGTANRIYYTGAIDTVEAEVARLSGERDRLQEDLDDYRRQWDEFCYPEFWEYWSTIGRPCSAGEAVRQLFGERDRLREAQDRTLYIAEHLFQMIPQEVWRESGAEVHGQYEGDHFAERTLAELKELRAALSAGAEQEAFCGRDDIDPHTWHHWLRKPDGSYGDYDDEGDIMRCPGAPEEPT